MYFQCQFIFLDRVLGFDDLCALYRASDVCLVSSIRDGMNLVSYEYVSCQDEKDPGVLIISEFAGSAQSLGAGAILVNPWDISSMSIALRNALKMNLEQRKEHQKILYDIVSTHTVQNWASDFIKKTHDAWVAIPRDNPIVPPRIREKVVRHSFERSKHRLIILGLFGGLSPYQKSFTSSEKHARMAYITNRMKQCIQQISNDKNTTVAIISSVTREQLDKLIGDVNVLQFAEKGYFVRNGGKDIPWHCVVPETIHLQWKEQMRAIIDQMRFFSDRLPRTHVEEGETSVTFKYDELNESNNIVISTMVTNVRRSLMNAGIAVQDLSSNMIEVRSNHVSLESTVQQILNHVRNKYHSNIGTNINNIANNDNNDIDFILCVGNLMACDEKLFEVLNELGHNNNQLKDSNIFTVTVGRKATRAKYYALHTQDVEDLLYECAQVVKKQENFNTNKTENIEKNKNYVDNRNELDPTSMLRLLAEENDNNNDVTIKSMHPIKSAPITPNFTQHPTIAMHPLAIFQEYQNTSSSASITPNAVHHRQQFRTHRIRPHPFHRKLSKDQNDQEHDNEQENDVDGGYNHDDTGNKNYDIDNEVEDDNINENMLQYLKKKDDIYRSKSDSNAIFASSASLASSFMFHPGNQQAPWLTSTANNNHLEANNVENHNANNINDNIDNNNDGRKENVLWHPGFVHSLGEDGNTVVSSSQLNDKNDKSHENPREN